MRPIGTAEELQRRRLRAVELVEQGESPEDVARFLGCGRSSVYTWVKLAKQSVEALAARPHPGPKPRLSAERLKELEGLLLQGAKAHGWRTQLGTAARVAELIERHFGVRFHPEHVRKILKRRLGWTSQKPKRKARERNDKEVERWLDDEFDRIVRDAFRRQAHLAFLDESGFFLTPTARRTLAPRGKTPVLDAWDRRDKISAISSITVSPQRQRLNLHFRLLPDNANVHAEDVVEYLRQLRAALPGPMTVIWDRNQIHSKAKVVRAYLAGQPDIVVEEFPAYAPELNPDEGVWGWTKYGKLSNLAAEDTDTLRDHLTDLLVELKFDADMLRSLIEETNLPLLL